MQDEKRPHLHGEENGILDPASMGIRDQLLAAVGRSGLSERRLSMLATGSTDTIRNIRRGTAPRVDTFEALCQVLGLELELGPVLSQPDAEDALNDGSHPGFSGSRELPVYEWSDPSDEGYLRTRDGSSVAPAPEDVLDEQAFYLRMPDHSMVPARIRKGDYCLVSPCAQLEVDQRAWFRHASGRETIRWVMRISAAGYDLGAWDLDDVGHQAPAAIHRNREDVVERGAVLAVYREEPSLTSRLPPVAEWRPDPLAELWRSSLFSHALKRVHDDLDKAVRMVDEMEMQIKRQAGQGAISDFHANQLLRAIDYRLQSSLREIRSSVIGYVSDGSGEAPRR